MRGYLRVLTREVFLLGFSTMFGRVEKREGKKNVWEKSGKKMIILLFGRREKGKEVESWEKNLEVWLLYFAISKIERKVGRNFL